MPLRRRSAVLLAAVVVVTMVGAALPALVPAAAAASRSTALGRTAPGATTAVLTPVLSLRRPLPSSALGWRRPRSTPVSTPPWATPISASPSTACLTVETGTIPLYRHNPTAPLLPASNLKLLTATAALDLLGSNDRYVTTVKSAMAPTDGTVSGNLYLVGGGDPLLYTPDYVASLPYPDEVYDNLDTLADQVRAAGVTKITGSVVGDESRYDTQRGVVGWSPSYLATGEVGPLSALSVNDGFASFKPALVAAPQPAEQAAATFSALLQARGVTVAGAASVGAAPPTAGTITTLDSPPLPAVLGEILRRSDNDGAELVTKELGRKVSATPTTAAGVAAIVADIGADGLPTSGLHMVDGSGLDRSDRVTCQLVLDTLMRSGPDGAIGAGLAVAAKSGTLFRRMLGTPAAGRLLAKTGTLDGVSALSGFVLPAGPARASGAVGANVPGTSGVGTNGAGTNGAGTSGLAFSLISNSVRSDAAGDALGNRVGVILAQFPQAPPLADLVPLPAP